MDDSSENLNQRISLVIAKVSKNNIERNLNKLSNFHTRHVKSLYINEAANWIVTELKSLGYLDTFYHEFTETIDNEKIRLRNIICRKNGKNDKVIIICAHYDCRNEDLNDSTNRSPGANDNASGVSTIMEIARVLIGEDLQYTLQFVFFSGEEHNLLGSKNYVKYIKNNGMNLHRLINLDMIGSPFLGEQTVIIERDDNLDQDHNKVKENDDKSIEFSKLMRDMIKYTDLQYRWGSIYDSDYEPFESEGYVVLGVYDGSADISNPYYHSSSDLPGLIDLNYLTSVTKLVLATILKISCIDI